MAIVPAKSRISTVVNLDNRAPPAEPSPEAIRHVHIFSGVNYEAMVDFYKCLLDAEIIVVHEDYRPLLTFLS